MRHKFGSCTTFSTNHQIADQLKLHSVGSMIAVSLDFLALNSYLPENFQLLKAGLSEEKHLRSFLSHVLRPDFLEIHFLLNAI